jgi:hypothetical protein
VPDIVVVVDDDSCFLFLSNSSHFVEPLTTDSLPRKSISFNTFWKGMVGVKEEALGSHVF